VIDPQSVIPADGSVTQFTTENADGSVVWGLSSSAPMNFDSAPKYPVRVSDNGRYLVDQRGHPWRIQADAAWLMSSEATPDEVEQYLDARKAQGFNSFYLMAMVHPKGYSAASHAPNNWRGDPPFAVAGDFSTAGASPESERYWEWIDWIIAQAAARDMVVMLSYTYLGWSGGDMGWYAEILAQPNKDSLSAWGKWLGERYKNDPNVIWFGLGDFAPPAATDGAARVVEIARGIKAAGAKQLFMAEASPPDTLPVEDPDFGSLLDIDSFYGYGPDGLGAAYQTAARAWKYSPARPSFMEEGTYEYENNWGHFSGKPWDTRRGRFWSVLSGAIAGDGFGSRDVWQWKDIPRSLHTPGAEYSAVAFSFFGSLPWWKFVPSEQMSSPAVIEGQDTWGGLDYISSAQTLDGGWLIAYVPVSNHNPRTFSIDMSDFRNPVRARWFDPVNGDYIAASDGYELPNKGEQSFTTPGRHADGTNDWILVVDSNNDSACGSITPTGLYTAPTTAPDGMICQVTAAALSDPFRTARTRLVFRSG
jgi:hypothetical protein